MPTQTGTVLTFPITNNANAGTVSSTITVPADATKVVVGVTCYQGTASGLDAMTFTKGGVDTAMTKVTGADTSTAWWQGAMFWLDDPDTGTNKTLKWDWIGTGTSAEPDWICSVTFWKEAASGVGDSDGDQNGSLPYTTPTLTATSGDKIVAFAFGFVTGAANGTIDTWSNLTELAELTNFNWTDGAWATGDPSGSTTVAASTGTLFSDGGIVAVVLNPLALAEKQTYYASRRRSWR